MFNIEKEKQLESLVAKKDYMTKKKANWKNKLKI